MSDALQLDEMDCLLCLLAGHEEVRLCQNLDPGHFHLASEARVSGTEPCGSCMVFWCIVHVRSSAAVG